MTVNLQQIQTGAIRYVEEEIANKAVGFNKFVIYFILPKISTKIVEMAQQYRANPIFGDLFDVNGNVDLDSIYSMAKNAIARSGQFTLYGIIFNETDIDKIYEYIRNTTI